MLAPQPEHLMALLKKYFDSVEIIAYPLFQAGKTTAIVARSKKQKEISETTTKIAIPTTNGFFASFFKAIRSQDWWLYKIPPLLAIADAEILLLDLSILRSILTVSTLLAAIACVAVYGHLINDSFDIEVDHAIKAQLSQANATNPDDLQLYYQALETQPDDAHIHLRLGNALVRQGQIAEAIARYQTALQYHPDNFEVQLELGKALEKEKQWDETIGAYRRAISLNPTHALAHQHLGDALAERGQLHEASLSCRRVLQLQ